LIFFERYFKKSYFDTKEITSQDVTAEYIDIDARLKLRKFLKTGILNLNVDRNAGN
jgi:hypothetical protein